MRKAVEDAGLGDRIACDSAGLEGWHVGRAPDPRAVRAGSLRGYELVALRARMVEPVDFHDFDLIICMDREHLTSLEAEQPRNARAELHLLLDFAPAIAARHGPDVPDPYSGTEADFEHALDLIEQGVAGLLSAIKRAAP